MREKLLLIMIGFRLIVLTLLMTITTGFPSSSPSPPISPPEDLIEDLRRIATKIFSDRENIEKLTSQIQKISSVDPNLFNSIEVDPKSTQMAPESSQPGGNPLVVVQSRINAFFESMNQLFKNMRQVIERIPVPEDAELNPLKALQTLENQFQNILGGLVVPDPVTAIKPGIVNGTSEDKPQPNGINV